LAAGALLAMVIGHAVELALENNGLVGDVRATYHHSAQAMALELALLGLLAAVGYAAQHIWSLPAHDQERTVPGLDSIRRMGSVRVIASLVSAQFAALIAVELLEQHLSGFNGPGLSAIFGAGHVTAFLVHAVVGVVAGSLLYSFAFAVCSHSRELATIVCTFLRRFQNVSSAPPAADCRRANLDNTVRKLPVLALKFANRPPPGIAAA
jgi:hypothetical protein